MSKPPHYLPHHKDNTKICSACGSSINVWPEHVRACEACWNSLTPAEKIMAAAFTRAEDWLRQQWIMSETDRSDDALDIQFARLAKAIERKLVDEKVQAANLIAVIEKLLARIEAIPVAENNVTKPPPSPSSN